MPWNCHCCNWLFSYWSYTNLNTRVHRNASIGSKKYIRVTYQRQPRPGHLEEKCCKTGRDYFSDISEGGGHSRVKPQLPQSNREIWLISFASQKDKIGSMTCISEFSQHNARNLGVPLKTGEGSRETSQGRPGGWRMRKEWERSQQWVFIVIAYVKGHWEFSRALC